MYTSKVTGKRQITIPKEICEMLDVGTGDHVDFVVRDKNITFKKADIRQLCPYCTQSVGLSEIHVIDNGQKYHYSCYVQKSK